MLIGLTEETPVQKPGSVLVGKADIFQKNQFRAQVQDFVQGFFVDLFVRHSRKLLAESIFKHIVPVFRKKYTAIG